MTAADEFAWLDAQPGKHTGLENRAEIMRPGAQDGQDRVWWTDGEYIWFRRAKANPATLERHNKFCATGDYVHVETQGDLEIYQLQPQSPFKTKNPAGKTVDISKLDLYNLRRQAAMAACRRDWLAFRDVMTFLRERINAMFGDPQRPGAPTPLSENVYAEQYMGVMLSIEQRQGPSPDEVNRELMSMAQKAGELQSRVITIGNNTV